MKLQLYDVLEKGSVDGVPLLIRLWDSIFKETEILLQKKKNETYIGTKQGKMK